MNRNYQPPQLKNKEFLTWARNFLVEETERRSKEASEDVGVILAGLDVKDFISFILKLQDSRFCFKNVQTWTKDARKALKHADRCFMAERLANSNLGNQNAENAMNRALYPRSLPSAAANDNCLEGAEEGNAAPLKQDPSEPPQKRRRRQRPANRWQEVSQSCSVPSARLDSVPFIDADIISRLLSVGIACKLRSLDANDAASEQPATGCLVLGPRGSGKTALVRAVAGELNLPLITASAVSITGVPALTPLFDKAVEEAPSVLLLTQVEALPVHFSGKIGTAPNVMDAFLEGLRRAGDRVVVLGESSCSQALLNDSVKQLFPKSVILGAMDLQARRAALRHLIVTHHWEERISTELEEELVRRSPGFEVGDLFRLLEEIDLTAPLHAYRNLFFNADGGRLDTAVSLDDLQACYRAADMSSREVVDTALRTVVPLARQKPGFVSVPSVCWADVGAMEEAKRELERFLTIVQDPELADALCRDAESLLLVGPPGCGKTMLAKAVSNEAGLNFISVKGPELFDKYQGESERRVREVFERARACPPCLIFFDELDALCGRRSGDSNDGRSSVVLQLLTEMDGLTPRGRVFVMGATNRLDIIDEAFLRRGRMGRVVHVGPPASVAERVSVLCALCRNGTRPSVVGNVAEIFERIASDPRVADFTGADLRGVLDEAKFAAQKDRRDYLTETDFFVGLTELCRELEVKMASKRAKR